ncbi:MAG: EAL and HDOD domain-containing protein [Syntrophobacteraceae bacterium]
MDVFVARQPIFDAKQRVYGYELLYRANEENVFPDVDGDRASLSVIRSVMLLIGSRQMCGGRKAFINFTRNLILDGAASYLPKEIGVVEILEDVEPDPQLLKAVKTIRAAGYPLALDDFILRGNENNPLLDLVNIIKVDFRQTDERERSAIAKRFPGDGKVKLLAEKTETREEFRQGLDMGYRYFQGFFFCKPQIISRREIPGYKLNYLRILKELSTEEPSYNTLGKSIEQDPALTYKLLKYINSVFFGLRREVTSIRQALALLGENEIRKWAALAILMELGKDHPHELMKLSLLRARLCEEIAASLNCRISKSELFFLGLFSCMDVVMGRPMEEILQDIPISESLRGALLGDAGEHREVLDLVIACERANWEKLSLCTSDLCLSRSALSETYAESIGWVERAFQT